jgi:EAL domain-containing protein (putative c-di-GMP-specific phosphodiesterase class I)
MTGSKNYYDLINSISSAVVVLSPVYDYAGSISDFCICFINRPYKELSRGLVRNGQKISDFKSYGLSDIDWLAVCISVVTENRQFKTSYYSSIAQTYLYVTVCKTSRKNGNKFCILTLTDISTINTAGIKVFHPEVHGEFLHRTLLQKRLEQAAEQEKFKLNFQPQFIIQTKQLRGFEALLRWSDKVLGKVNPDDFIPVAEETRSIVKIGYWVLEAAIQKLKYWQNEFAFNGIMSVNISPVQLEEAGFAEKLFDLIQQYDIRPDRLELEVTESVFIHNIQETIQILNKIHQKGILISLDDFGTGYSSFRYLQFLPVSTIKIDKSFISRLIPENRKEAVIADTVISLAVKLGLETIAEGVEYSSQLTALKIMGCTTVQGFLCGKPVDSGQCELLFNSYKS